MSVNIQYSWATMKALISHQARNLLRLICSSGLQRHWLKNNNKKNKKTEKSNLCSMTRVMKHHTQGTQHCAHPCKSLQHQFNPHRGQQHSFVETDHEIFSTVILSLPLIQERQLSVSGERMCTILVNRLED